MAESLIGEVTRLYQWLDTQIQAHVAHVGKDRDCQACGRCCDFASYDHRLYVTTPELLHFVAYQGGNPLRAMHDGICPYREEGKCSVYNIRFTGCRIFGCQRSEDVHSRLSETVLCQLKALCTAYDVPYRYVDLAMGLNTVAPTLVEPAGGSCAAPIV